MPKGPYDSKGMIDIVVLSAVPGITSPGLHPGLGVSNGTPRGTPRYASCSQQRYMPPMHDFIKLGCFFTRLVPHRNPRHSAERPSIRRAYSFNRGGERCSCEETDAPVQNEAFKEVSVFFFDIAAFLQLQLKFLRVTI